MKLIVLISGEGTNLQALIDAKFEIELVVSNKRNAYGLDRAENAGINNVYTPYDKDVDTRETYDAKLICDINRFRNRSETYLIVCAGYMRILSPFFIHYFNKNIINLHPALPGEFPGATAIEDAYRAFKSGKITRTGIMIHYVTEVLDGGKPIATIEIPIHKTDSLNDLKNRIKYNEKKLLINVINEYC
jgi:formyltetrahydrofolate-dependent phosphoribosylglycinamide formyltransferase